MKFRLSTIIFTIAIVAIALGWLVDRNSRSRIAGSWAYPPPDSSLNWTSTRYSDFLSISADGSFTKTQDYGISRETYSGTMHTDQTGLTTFHVTSVTAASEFGTDQKSDVDFRFLCRCAVDKFGYLVVNEYLAFREHQDFDQRTANVQWRSYSRQ